MNNQQPGYLQNLNSNINGKYISLTQLLLSIKHISKELYPKMLVFRVYLLRFAVAIVMRFA